MKIVPDLQKCTQERLLWGSCLLCATSVLLIAAWINPSPLGYGSHLQLGLPPCGILVWSGVPCPSCGLTTSFAHLIRGQWTAAWHANPFGVFLFAGAVLSIPFAILGLLQARPFAPSLERVHAAKVLLALSCLGLVLWLWRLP